jgi:hypothetical protein
MVERLYRLSFWNFRRVEGVARRPPWVKCAGHHIFSRIHAAFISLNIDSWKAEYPLNCGKIRVICDFYVAVMGFLWHLYRR